MYHPPTAPTWAMVHLPRGGKARSVEPDLRAGAAPGWESGGRRPTPKNQRFLGPSQGIRLKLQGRRGTGRSGGLLCILNFMEQPVKDMQRPHQLILLLEGRLLGRVGLAVWVACLWFLLSSGPRAPGSHDRRRGPSREHWPESRDGGSQALLLHCSVT